MSEDAAWLLGFLVIAGGIGAIFYLRITREAPAPAQAGPEATEVLRYLAGMRVAVITDTVFVRSTGATREMVQRTALRLARAIEADARG